MRCPKCGAFMEVGKDTCMMCGTNVNTYVPEDNPNADFSRENSDSFGSGNDFIKGAKQNIYEPPKFQENEPVQYAPLNKKDKDIFDRYQENKSKIKVILILILIIAIAGAGFLYYKSRTKEPEKTPMIHNLYFIVDETFSQTSGSSTSNTISFAKSGERGNDCSISVSISSNTSENHVDEFFNTVKKTHEPAVDTNGNIINELDVYTPKEDSIEINSTTWHYLNIFYKSTPTSNPNILKYKYLTATDKGLFYDITLINNSNDATCSISLDNFTKSLQFLE